VNQSGGYLRVRTSLGKGAEVMIYVPRTDAIPEKSAHAERRDDRPASGTILVVEDEPAVRSALGRILVAGGYKVLSAENGTEALKLFGAGKDPVDLLITDLVMPGIGGRDLARQCSAIRDSLKVIYISGYTRDSLLSPQTFEEGTEFIEKPFTSDAILDRIARVLQA
jgi:DNA-binding NtrC family response regulator